MDFPKKQAQRLIPEYLLDYTTDLQKNHPDPSASWGGGSGGSYTAGDGINISSSNVISVDNTIAKKSEIPTKTSDLTNDSGFITTSALTGYVTTTQLEDALDDYALTTDIPTEVSQLTNDAGYTTQTWVENQGYSTFSGDYNDLTNKPTIPVVPTNISAFTNDVGYITGITSSDVVTALGYTPGTSNFSGDYDDLTNKPTIPTVNDPTITFLQGSAIKGTIHLNQSENSSIVFDAGVEWDDITNKPTFSTVATTGSYNDLSDKPIIPTDCVTLHTNQTITGTKTFVAPIEVKDAIVMRSTIVNGQGYFVYRNNANFQNAVTLFDLPTSKTAGTEQQPTQYTIATTDDIPSLTGYATEQWVTNQGYSTFSGSYNDLTNKPTYSTVATTGSYNDLTNKPDLSIYAESADLSTVATSGSYNDLTDKPTIPTNYVTLDTDQSITGNKYFNSSHLIVQSSGPVVQRLFFTPYTFKYRTGNSGIDFALPTSKTSGTEPTTYTLATTDDIVTSYNDLTDKPTIPTVNNPTITFTQGGTTKGTITLNQSGDQTIALDAGGGGSSAPYEITNMVVDSTNQTVTLTIVANN